MAGFDPLIQSISAKTGAEANLAFALVFAPMLWRRGSMYAFENQRIQYPSVNTWTSSLHEFLVKNACDSTIRAYSDYRIPSINDSLAIRDLIFEVRLNRVSLVRYIGLFWTSNMHMHIHYFTKQSIVK